MKNLITFPWRMKGTSFSFMSLSSHRTIISNDISLQYMCFAKLSTCIKCDIFLHTCTLVFILHFDFWWMIFFCAAC